MAYNLLRWERDQSYLMPPSMRDWLSEGHLAWFIVDAVGQMDLREFYAVYRSDGWGAAEIGCPGSKAWVDYLLVVQLVLFLDPGSSATCGTPRFGPPNTLDHSTGAKWP